MSSRTDDHFSETGMSEESVPTHCIAYVCIGTILQQDSCRANDVILSERMGFRFYQLLLLVDFQCLTRFEIFGSDNAVLRSIPRNVSGTFFRESRQESHIFNLKFKQTLCGVSSGKASSRRNVAPPPSSR